jgi:hypothetical protein
VGYVKVGLDLARERSDLFRFSLHTRGKDLLCPASVILKRVMLLHK